MRFFNRPLDWPSFPLLSALEFFASDSRLYHESEDGEDGLREPPLSGLQPCRLLLLGPPLGAFELHTPCFTGSIPESLPARSMLQLPLPTAALVIPLAPPIPLVISFRTGPDLSPPLSYSN